jgi:multisubunit Na+/H+ antiporter MnhB subunit
MIAPKLTQGEPMDTLLAIHSFVRWIIILVAVMVIIKFAISWMRNSAFKGMDRGLVSAYSGLLDLQVMIGLIYLIWNGIVAAGFPAYRIEHGVTMLIAAAVGHLPARFKNMHDKLRFQYSLLAVVGSLVLIGIGILFLVGHSSL